MFQNGVTNDPKVRKIKGLSKGSQEFCEIDEEDEKDLKRKEKNRKKKQ